MEADFPFARTLMVVRNERLIKKTGESSLEPHYYLSSVVPEQYGPEQWLHLIRGHWGGVENRNHWRRDALMGEDASRSRKATLLANVALLRSALLQVLALHLQTQSLPQLREHFSRHTARALALLTAA